MQAHENWHHVGTRLNDRHIDGQIDYPNTPDISDNLEHKIRHDFYGTLKLIFDKTRF